MALVRFYGPIEGVRSFARAIVHRAQHAGMPTSYQVVDRDVDHGLHRGRRPEGEPMLAHTCQVEFPNLDATTLSHMLGAWRKPREQRRSAYRQAS